MTKFYIPHSQKSLREFSESKSENSVNNFQGAWGDFVFLRKNDFALKWWNIPPKSENEENGSQKTKETVTFIRVGAMGAEMLFFAPNVRNFDDFAIWEPKWDHFYFLEQNPENNISDVLLTTKRARIVL